MDALQRLAVVRDQLRQRLISIDFDDIDFSYEEDEETFDEIRELILE
jgi:hypothetical protein